MKIFEFIKNWLPVRAYTENDVSDEDIDKILEAGRLAYSGLNNQPWRFMVIKEPALKSRLADLTKYTHILNNANALIAIFLDHESMYHHGKDLIGIGGCVQNMLLTMHDMGIGGAWMGEILNQKNKVEEILQAPKSCELALVLAIGYPLQVELEKTRPDQKPLSELILKKYY